MRKLDTLYGHGLLGVNPTMWPLWPRNDNDNVPSELITLGRLPRNWGGVHPV
jgi:hypothetical protein